MLLQSISPPLDNDESQRWYTPTISHLNLCQYVRLLNMQLTNYLDSVSFSLLTKSIKNCTAWGLLASHGSPKQVCTEIQWL